MPSFPTPINPLVPVLEKRRLTPAEAVALDLQVIDADTARAELDKKLPGLVSAQRLIYFDEHGEPLIDPKTSKVFCRYRLEHEPGFKFKDGSLPHKYDQPYGTSGHMLFLPKGMGVDWLAVTGDTKQPILFVEGEYKAIAGCKMGIPTIGLGGIWMFDPNNRKMPAPMTGVNFFGRPVPICFDADPSCDKDTPLRPDIELKAAQRFASKLAILGAEPVMVYIARTETFLKQSPRVKMGIDDFRDAGGTLDELMATMEKLPEENLVLAQLMQDWCLGLFPKPFVMNRHDPRFKHSPGDFKQTIVADKRIKVQEGDRIKFIPAGEVFLQSPLRPSFRHMRFDPSNDFGLDQERETFNTWEGMWTQPGMKGPDEYARDVAIWRKYLAGLVGEEWVDYVEKWVAHLIQRPGEKTTIAMVITGKTEGTGKSLLGAIIGALVGERYRVQKPYAEIFDTYGGRNLESKLLIQVEESEGLSRVQMAKLRDFVTNPTTTINIKNVATYDTDNVARVLVTANSEVPVKMEETSRRWFVVRTPLTQKQVEDWWREWTGKEVWERFCLDKSEDGAWPRRHLMYHLKNMVDLRDWLPNASVPITEAAEDMIEAASGAGELGMVEVLGMLRGDKDGYWILPKNVAALNSSFWTNFISYLKVKGGEAYRMETRAFGERDEVRVLVPLAGSVPLKQLSKGGGKFRTVVDPTAWGETGVDNAALMRAKDRLISSFEQVAPVLRLSDDHMTAVRRLKGNGGPGKY